MEPRPAAPHIPDHEVLRCIGKGSYGEVWLARAVTGTLRAVKVVRREDFELDRTFEREFEGIMKFEPVSREHPGLVHILHVGRNDEQQFYYYVMELGDDRERGSRTDASDYEPRTLGSDKTLKHRLPVAECIEIGAQVAEGLAHLHECGLTHRDIKPANIIFLNGRAKLADIGLVAAAGQMTFVGTEGFVPPEGPGSKLADIYSLGMVLYELSTGKDRLQFPELPDDLGEARTRPQWLALNEIILKACALQPKKRCQSARELAAALRAASRRQPRRGPWLRRLLALPVLTAAAAFALVTWQHNGAMPWPPGRFAPKNGIAPPPPERPGQVQIETLPPGAEVLFQNTIIGRTPLLASIPAGDATFTLRRKRYRDASLHITNLLAGQQQSPEPLQLRFDNPPKPAQPWENSLGMVFDPETNRHLSRRAVSYDQLLKIQAFPAGGVVKEPIGPNEVLYMVSIPPNDALRFCDELTQRETQEGWLTPDLCYRPEPYTPKDPKAAKDAKSGTLCFRVVVEKFGSVTITSDPPGAEVFEASVRLGSTPWLTSRHRPGPLEFRLTLPGYTDATTSGLLLSGSSLALRSSLLKNKRAVFGKNWQNSLGIPFRVLSPELLVAAWETRVQDYAAFAQATSISPRPPAPDPQAIPTLEQTPDHPVVNVTRAEARLFCQWLTRTEREAAYLDDTMEYRLPTDAEWSLAAGSPNLDEAKQSPFDRHLAVLGVYPWRPPYQFPPPQATGPELAAGNLGDLAALRRNLLGPLKPPAIKALEALGYDDGVPFTAPVGRFAPNGIGLLDLSGNAREFVNDDYGGDTPPERPDFAVLRGGAWNTPATDEQALATQFRQALPPDQSDNFSGFRIVLASLAPQTAPTAPLPSAFPEPLDLSSD